MWKIVVFALLASGEVDSSSMLVYKKYEEDKRWTHCHPQAVRMTEKGQAKGFYAACVKDAA